MTNDWDTVGFVVSSRYRIVVLRRLAEGPASPSTIAADADVAISHVSRALSELREYSLVELLVPEPRKKGRIYGLAESGEEVWERIESAGLA
jgi:DNA-binding transcriptional ArsR family regulator